MPKRVEIAMQPKQTQMYELLRDSKCPVIGCGGGRGSAKSSGADRAIIALMYERRGIKVCMVMRTWGPQMVPFHLEAIRHDYPWLSSSLKVSPPAVLHVGTSTMEFKYAENYDAVVVAFRSGNYDLLCIDQAEQFTEREIREMRKACRSAGGETPKTLLVFNMRGASIQTLRKWFYLKEVNKDEDPNDYVFLKMNPWDNVEWVRAALKEDGYTVDDYYRWTDDQRKRYAATRGPYTRQLASDDEVIRQADWEGDWDSLEGAYFANTFDLESVRCSAATCLTLDKVWATHWIAQDWGKTHFCATYWAYRVSFKPSEALEYLGWELVKSINITVIYREMIVNQMEAAEVAQSIIDCTPESERSKCRSFFVSPEEVTDDPNSIGSQESRRMRQVGMPAAVKADNDRKGGWGLMGALFKATKGHGWGTDKDGKRFQYDDAVFISSECPQLLNSIPTLLRDPKNLDDVLKTDLGTAKVEQDVSDACFVAGTSVVTRRGFIAIEKIEAGDEVMTRYGWRRVNHAWMTMENAPIARAEFSNGSVIVCTKNHRIATERGFISLDSLRYSDKIISWNQLSLTEKSTASEKTDTTLAEENSCTVPYGSSTEVQSPENTLFTTSIMRQSGQQTSVNLHVSPQESIPESMVQTVQIKQSIWRIFAHWLLRGINLLKAGNGIERMPLVESFQGMRSGASSVGCHFKELQKASFAQIIANQHGGVKHVSILSNEAVSYAGKSLPAINTTRPNTVAENAVRLLGLQEAGYADVYDLDIEDAHEFFANWILVHNCRYLVKSMLAPKQKTAETIFQEELAKADPSRQMIMLATHQFKKKAKPTRYMPPSWQAKR